MNTFGKPHSLLRVAKKMSSQDSKEFHKSVHLDCFWDQGKEDRGVVE